MSDTPPALPSKDLEHLKLLSLFHYIVGGLGVFFACFPLFHVFFGLMMMFKPEVVSGQGSPPPFIFGAFMVGLGLTLTLLGWATAICTIISGRMLAQRKRRMFSFVVAAILCVFMPLGTVLGVFTIIVLSRDSVRRLYGEAV